MQRRPMLLLALDGVLLLRLPARKLTAVLLKLPPRLTRLEALDAVTRALTYQEFAAFFE